MNKIKKLKLFEPFYCRLFYGKSVLFLICALTFTWVQGTVLLMQQTLTGTVTDAEGAPLPGASVLVKGTTNGTISDFDGHFGLEVSQGNIIVVSYTGMKSQEIPFSGQSNLQITLVEDLERLDEVVVIGYGSVKKSDLTGSVASIKAEDVQIGVINSVEKQLSGKVSGVYVVQTSGQPGAGTSVRIRGTNSILGNNEPLYVVDGIPYGNSLGYELNPMDVESVEILKDASSTAIYGSRGANGVVLITTKKGKSGATRVNFETYFGMSSLAKKMELLNAEGISEIQRRSVTNGGQEFFNPDEVHGNGTDWQDELYYSAPSSNYQLTVAGGGEKFTYLFSGNYFNEEGIVKNSGAKRYSVRSNLNSIISEKFTLGSNLYISQNNINEGGYIGDVLMSNPTYPLLDELGNYTIFTSPTGQTGNPVGSNLLNINENNSFNFLGNLFADYKITKDLRANLSIGAKTINQKNNLFFPSTTNQGVSSISASVGNISSVFWNSNNTLTYNHSFNDKHNLNVMGGFIIEKQRIETAIASSNGFVTNEQEYHSLQSGENQSNASSLNENQLVSFISRINYNMADKYLISLSARYDGSSRFSAENQWALFPSGAFAWRISNEDFLKENQTISNLKLRIGAGMAGEQAIPSYQTLASLASTSNLYAGDDYKIGFYPNRLANPSLEWEKTTQYDVGLDLGLWNNRISLTTDYYYKVTNDLLFYKALPKSSGYSSLLSNVGSLENKGLEISLNTNNLKGTFEWSTEFNISFNQNKILSLGQNPDGSDIERILSPDGAEGQRTYLGDQNALIKGEHIGGAFGYIYDGTYKNTDEIANGPEPKKVPGDPKFKDLNNDGTINSEDRTIISNPNPKFSGGLTNAFSYKGFELNIFMQFVYDNSLFNYTHLDLSYFDGNFNNYQDALNSWTPENPNSNIPRANWDVRANGINSFHVEDASYLRIKNITMGYNFDIRELGWNISKLRLYASMDNFFTFTDYSGYSPDVSAFGTNSISAGFDNSVYPLSKTILFGLNIEF